MMRNDSYAGILHGAKDGSGLSCRIFPRGDGLELQVNGVHKALLSYASLEVSFTGMDDKYLCFAARVGDSDLKALVSDKEIAKHIEALGAPRNVLDQLRLTATRLQRRKIGRFSVLGALATIVFIVVIAVWAAFGWFVDRVVDEIPSEWEVELGRTSASEVLSEHNVCMDPVVNKAVQEIGQRLMLGLGTTPYQWRIKVLDNEDVNAFAVPGGYIFINRGLLEQSSDPYEVAGVLAHEIQHVTHRHGIKNMVRQIGLMLIVYALVGDAGEVERFLVGNAAGFASMSFSRDQETEADIGGMELMYRSSLDPTGLPRFMFKLAEEEGALGSALTILSTHPASQDRGESLNELINAWGRPQVNPLTSDWTAIKGVCSPIKIEDPDQY